LTTTPISVDVGGVHDTTRAMRWHTLRGVVASTEEGYTGRFGRPGRRPATCHGLTSR
jgi:hypothetical protein